MSSRTLRAEITQPDPGRWEFECGASIYHEAGATVTDERHIVHIGQRRPTRREICGGCIEHVATGLAALGFEVAR